MVSEPCAVCGVLTDPTELPVDIDAATDFLANVIWKPTEGRTHPPGLVRAYVDQVLSALMATGHVIHREGER